LSCKSEDSTYVSWKVESDVDADTGELRWLSGFFKLGCDEGQLHLGTYLYHSDDGEDAEDLANHLEELDNLYHEVQAYRRTLKEAIHVQKEKREAALLKKVASLEEITKAKE
jgi:hypothetical protein